MKKSYPNIGRLAMSLLVASMLFSCFLSAATPFSAAYWNTPSSPRQITQARSLGSIPFYSQILQGYMARQQQSAGAMLCFDNFTAGPDTSYCQGETATLVGGYDMFLGVGSESLSWSIVSGTGLFSYMGGPSPQINVPQVFSLVGAFDPSNLPTYTPGVGEISATLRLTSISSDTNCDVQTDDVILYFDPFPQPQISYSIETVPSDTLVPAEMATDTICPGTELGLSIVNASTIPPSQQEGHPVFYEVEVTNAGGLMGVPAAGTYYLSAGAFASTFSSLTLNNTTGATQRYIVSVKGYYETNSMSPGAMTALCTGDALIFDFAVLNTPQATSGIVGVVPGNPNFCEGEDAQIRITGTTFTTVTYRVDTMAGGALLIGADSTIDINASGIADVFLLTDGLAGDSLIFNLLSIRYQTAAGCERPLNEVETVIVLERPEASIGLVFQSDTVRCNGNTAAIEVRLFTDAAGDYDINYEVFNGAGVRDTLMASLTTTSFGGINSDDFTVIPPASGPLGDSIFIRLLDIIRTDIAPNCAATISDTILVIEEAESFAAFEVQVSGQDSVIASPNNTPVIFNVCDETDLSISLDSFNQSLAGLPTRMRVRIIEDEYNLLGFGTVLSGGTEIVLDTTVVGFDVNAFLDVPNNLTSPTAVRLAIRPYFEKNGIAGVSGADCVSANGIAIRVNILPRPTADLMTEVPADTTVCVGETINLRITGPENGSVVLATGIAGASETIQLDATGLALVPKTITESTLFTLTTVTTIAPPACTRVLNRQLIINTESRPTATIALVEDTICFEASTMLAVMITGSAPAYDFTIDSLGTPVSYTATGDTMLPINMLASGGVFTLTQLSNAGTTRNCPWVVPNTLPADTLVVESQLTATAAINFPSASLSLDGSSNPTGTVIVCSGDSTLTMGTMVGITGTDPSTATGDSVYFRVQLTDPLGAFPGLVADQILQLSGGALDNALAGQIINNTLAVSADIVITLTPFFFDDSNGAPSLADFGQACQGNPITATIRVNPLPRITFGGNTTICEGDATILTFTGFPNGSITVSSTASNPGFPMGFNSGDIVTLNNTGVGTLTVNPAATVTYTVGNITDGTPQMCVNATTLDVIVEVVPTPDVAIGAITSPICSGTTTTFELENGPVGAVVYYHIDTVSTSGTLFSGTVTLDGTGAATVSTPILAEDVTVFIDSIDTQSPIVCRNILGYDFLIEVNAPPAGTLSSNGPVCVGEEILLTYDDGLMMSPGDYTLTINGNIYSSVTPGTPFAAVDTVTTYVLNAVTQEFGLLCTDTITNGIDTLDVVIEAIPAVTLSGTLGGVAATATAATPFADTVCSGTSFTLSTMGMPATSSTGDPLFYEITLSDTANVLGQGSGSILVPATGANTLLSSIGNTLTYTGSGDLALLSVAVLPYYESNPSGPDGPLTADACPGDTVFVDISVRQQLEFPTLTPDMATICQDSSVILNFTGGTPSTRVTFFYNGLTDVVDLDGNGDGQSEAIALTATTNFFITGISTLPPAAACTRLRTPTAPVTPFDITVTVVPTPFVTTFAFQQDTICDGDDFVVNIQGTPNATVYYDIPDVLSGTAVTNGVGIATFTVSETLGAPALVGESLTVFLDSIVSNTQPSCPNPLNLSITGFIKPLPQGTITASGPACAGGSVDLIFNATTSPVQDSFRIRVFGPNGSLGVSVVEDGGVAYTVTEPGTYYLERIRDNFGNGMVQGASCVNVTAGNAGSNLDSAVVIIELEPQLGATALGTSGVIALNNQSFVNIFATAVCSGDDLVVPFSTTTPASQAANPFTNPLYVQVTFSDPSELLPSILPAAAGQTSPFVIPFDDLDFNGVLENTSSVATTLNVTLTPYFEDSTSVTSLEMGECAGRTLQFNITILPELTATVDTANSTATVCADGDIEVVLNGSAGARVFFGAVNISLSTPSPVTLDATGMFTIVGQPIAAGVPTSITLDSIDRVTNVLGQNRLCRFNLNEQFDITVNALPTGGLLFEPAGPICNGETATLNFVTTHGDGAYELLINGDTYLVNVVNDTAVVLTQAFAADTTFNLSQITDFNGCVSMFTGNSATLEVEEVPAAEIEVRAPSTATSVFLENGEASSFSICTGDNIIIDGAFLTTALGGANFFQLQVSGAADFFGLGAANTTVAIAEADLGTTLSATLQNLGNIPLSTTVVITPYIEKNGNGMLDAGDCSSDPITITVTVNPTPITVDISSSACSDEEHTVNLMSAVTNGVMGVSFAYTAISSAPAVVPAPANCASGCNPLTASFTNTSNNPVVITYTVTPFLNGCRGNDFTLTDTIHPEPVLAVLMSSPLFICGDEPTGLNLSTINSLAGMTTFRLADVTFSSNSPDFTAAASNAAIGSVGNSSLISADTYQNLSSDTVLVLYSIVPISARGCEGDTALLGVRVFPEPKVADLVIEVCSGARLGFDIIQDLVENQVGSDAFFIRRKLVGTTLIVLDENNNQECSTNNDCSGLFGLSSFGQGFIGDSIINTGTATQSIFYDIVVQDLNGCGDDGVLVRDNGIGSTSFFGNVFTLEVRVREEADVDINAASTDFCTGDPITLSAVFSNGSATPTYVWTVDSQDATVTSVTLTPNGTGSAVTVDGSGFGSAVIRVVASDLVGCVATNTIQITLGETPAAQNIQGFATPCLNSFVSPYSVNITAGNTYSWSLSNPIAGSFVGGISSGVGLNGVIIDWNLAGPVTLTCVETSTSGCSRTHSIALEVVQESSANFSFTVDPVNNLLVNFTENAQGDILGYNWNFGDGVGSSTMANPSYEYAAAGTYDVRLITASLCGGSLVQDTIIRSVTVGVTVVCQDLVLNTGNNFVSLFVDPFDTDLESNFGSISEVVQIRTFDNGARLYQPGGGIFNSLASFTRGFGYIISVSAPVTVQICGTPEDGTYRRPLDAGTNFVGSTSPSNIPAVDFFATLEANGVLNVAYTLTSSGVFQNYFPGGGIFNSLTSIEAGRAYIVVTTTAVGGNTYRANPGGEESEFVYGIVSGLDLTTDNTVEVINQAGEVIAHLEVRPDGTYAATAIYGEMARVDGSFVEGLQEEEAYFFRYQDKTIDAGLSYQGGSRAQRIDLDFSEPVTVEEITAIQLGVSPNPMVDQARVQLKVVEADNYELSVMDVNGRQIATIFSGRIEQAGQYDFTWQATTLPSGVYTLMLRKGRELVPEVTQRIVK